MSRALGVLPALAILIAPAALARGSEAEKPQRVETPIRSEAAGAKAVKESFVRIHVPLPESSEPHPTACDWLSYLRFRSAGGPRRSSDADAVLAIMPGFLGGASSFDQVARNTVRNAARRGREIEFWALDRRSNCLEDHTGVMAAARARDPSVAYQYYWGEGEVDGQRFAGFVPPEEAGWLSEVGLEQTMRDWYAVLREGVPSRRLRARKVICGGHSMGGPLTATFVGWDFDGDPETRDDAGYRQCAGLVGFDTRFEIGTPGGSASPIGVLIGASEAAGSPYVNTTPLTPETIQLPPVFSVGSYFSPRGTDLLPELPHTPNIDLAQRFLFSRDAAHFATGVPDIRDFTLTNEVVLAGVFDDNSAPLGFIRSSLGFPTGGPLTDKNFPSPDPTLALPEEPSTPLYSWQGYDQVGVDGAELALNDEGQPYTSRESEVSDLSEFARTMFEAPANFIEQYFPIRLTSDLADAGEGDRSGELENLRYDGVAKRSAMLVNAMDSDDNSGEDGGRPVADEPPNGRPLSGKILIPGYNHLDVLTASRSQNDGRPEPAARAVTRFTLEVLKDRRK